MKYIFSSLAVVLVVIRGFAHVDASQHQINDEANLRGTVAIRQQITDAYQQRGRPGLAGLGPWSVTFTAPVPADKFVDFQMAPLDAFETTPKAGSSTEFVVVLKNPDALLTGVGNLRPIGPNLAIRTKADGVGLGLCSISATFSPTGSGKPLPLALLDSGTQSAKILSLLWTPKEAVTFQGYAGEKALFERTPAHRTTPVSVTLQVLDEGNRYSYQATLPFCGAGDPKPTTVNPNPGAGCGGDAGVNPCNPPCGPGVGGNPCDPAGAYTGVEHRTVRLRTYLYTKDDITSDSASSTRSHATEIAEIDLRSKCHEAAGQLRRAEGSAVFPDEISLASFKAAVRANRYVKLEDYVINDIDASKLSVRKKDRWDYIATGEVVGTCTLTVGLR